MATVGTNYSTLADIVARTNPEGSIERDIAMRVARKNEIFQYLPMKEGNKPDGDQIVQAVKLPTVGYVKFNKAPTASKGQTAQKTDRVGTLKTYSDIDVELAKMNNYEAGWRASEDMLFVEAMNQQVASDIIYGNEATDPEKFTGLTPRYGTPATVRNNSGYYMIDGGSASGQTDNTSIWVLSLGMDGVYGLYGKGQSAGMSMQDLGVKQKADSDGNLMDVYRTEFRWNIGLGIKRPGAAVRIPNIDVSLLIGQTSAADLSTLLARATHLIEDGLGQTVILMNKTTKAYLDIQAKKETTLGLHDVEDTFGRKIMAFRGIPILCMDAITNAEARVAGTFQSAI
jgi:hypothetical protein